MDAMDKALREVVERIRAAAAASTTASPAAPLRIRGGGTKDFYGETPQGEVLDTTGLRGIASYEPSELVVTVRAGTPLAELEAVLAEKGQCLPFEPPRFGAAPGAGSVGGMVAAGLSGPARASVGAVRDYVLGAMLVNGRGDLLTFGGQVMKNVAGYDVSRVLAGSLGTLGLIAEVSLKVLPVAPAEATLVFECSQADALRLLNEWGGRPLPLNASCWCEREEGGKDAGVLTLRLRGAAAAVEAACAHLGGERQDDAVAARWWQSLRDQQAPWFDDDAAPTHGALWRVSVPQTAPVLAWAGAGTPLIEWHGAQRWYRAPAAQAAAIRAAAHAAGGHATLFRLPPGQDASGIARFDAMTPPVARIHQALVREFDPHGLFDRTRLLPAG
jgi:glycolate oxidase FAD binding subunit